MTKQEKQQFLALYPNAYQALKDAFMEWKGTLEGYFLEHPLGADAYRWCLIEGAVGLPDVVAETGGYVIVREGATVQFLALVHIGWSVYVEKHATAHFPALVKVDESVVVRKGASATFPALAKVGGNVVVREGATTQSPALAEIVGDVRVEEGATLTLKMGCVIGGRVFGDINWVD